MTGMGVSRDSDGYMKIRHDGCSSLIFNLAHNNNDEFVTNHQRLITTFDPRSNSLIDTNMNLSEVYSQDDRLLVLNMSELMVKGAFSARPWENRVQDHNNGPIAVVANSTDFDKVTAREMCDVAQFMDENRARVLYVSVAGGDGKAIVKMLRPLSLKNDCALVGLELDYTGKTSVRAALSFYALTQLFRKAQESLQHLYFRRVAVVSNGVDLEKFKLKHLKHLRVENILTSSHSHLVNAELMMEQMYLAPSAETLEELVVDESLLNQKSKEIVLTVKAANSFPDDDDELSFFGDEEAAAAADDDDDEFDDDAIGQLGGRLQGLKFEPAHQWSQADFSSTDEELEEDHGGVVVAMSQADFFEKTNEESSADKSDDDNGGVFMSQANFF